MDNNGMNNDQIKYIISRLLDKARNSIKKREQNPEAMFFKGHTLAYYEVLDTLSSELLIAGIDLSEMGLDFDLDKMFL